jgi:ribosomal protein S12 methylthiotransferase
MNRGAVYLHPVACPKANVDREKLGGMLESRAYKIVDSPSEASIAIVFGCAFIDDAKRESIDDILNLSSGGADCPEHIIVVGCMPEKYGEELRRSLPEVDAFVGNSMLAALPEIMSSLVSGRDPGQVLAGGDVRGGLLVGRPERICPTTGFWTRAVMIGDGCNNACTYCSIPHMRGRLRSRSIQSIEEESDLLVEQGARELVLAGQDTASFGLDRSHNPGLAALLSSLAKRYPGVWIRLSYVNPDNLDDDVADVLAEHVNVCNYVDLPIQHASPRILKAMGRGDRPEVLEDKIRNLRKAVPDVALRTSLIMGFPGETEEDLEVLKTFLKSQEFDMVGVFAFSPQPGTPAADLQDRVPDEIVQDRILEMVAFQDEISHARMEMLVGRELQVLIEEPLESGEASARSQYDMAEVDRIIRLKDCSFPPGSFITARIDSVSAPYEWTATATQIHNPGVGSRKLNS